MTEAMMRKLFLLPLAALGASTALAPALAAEGNAARGQRVFNVCAQCQSTRSSPPRRRSVV
jgi:cytochrome c2